MTDSVKESTEFVIHKSGWTKITPPKIIVFLVSLIISVVLAIILKNAWLLLGLLIPLAVAIIVAVQVFLLKYDYAVFCKDRVMFHKGFIMKKEKKEVFTGVKLVTVNQTVMGRILGYGDIQANLYGAGIIHIKDVKTPNDACKYIESMIVVPEGAVTHITVS